MNELKNPICCGEVLDNYLINEHGEVFTLDGTRVNDFINKNYKCVSVKVGKKSRPVAVHRLVAETFIPNADAYKLQVNHKDGDRLNNDVSNLEWCSREENINRMIDIGIIDTHKGIYNPSAKLTEEQVHEACRLICENNRMTLREIAFVTGISHETIRSIRSGHSWHYIANQYGIASKKRHRKSDPNRWRKSKKDKKFNDYRKGGPLSITLG